MTKDSVLNLEDVEGSLKTYKESLADKSVEDIKQIVVDFSKKIKETFTISPTTLEQSNTQMQDGISTTSDLFSHILKNKNEE